MTRLESASSFNLYKQCPRRYYYAYIEKLPGKESIHTVRGGIIHKAIEKFYNINIEMLNEENYEILLKVIAMNIFNSLWRENTGKINSLLDYNMIIAEHYYYESLKMVGNWFDVFIAKLKNEMQNKEVKDAFIALKPVTEYRIISEKFNVQGFIDAVYENNEGAILLDYKTSRKQEISKEYKLQLAIYSLLYRESKNMLPKKAGIMFLADGSEKLLEVDDGLINLAENECIKIQEKTKSNKKEYYVKKPGRLCKYSGGQCDYYGICRPFDND